MECLKKLEEVVESRLRVFQGVSDDIIALEKLLKRGGFPSYVMDLNYMFLEWDENTKRLLCYSDGDKKRPLIENPVSIRIRASLYFGEFVEKFINKVKR